MHQHCQPTSYRPTIEYLTGRRRRHLRIELRPNRRGFDPTGQISSGNVAILGATHQEYALFRRSNPGRRHGRC